MKTVRKTMAIRYDNCKEIEEKLEHYAREEGLILQKTGTFFWTFEKKEPQNLKYTITFFTEGSVFNPHPTDNQLTYFDYAKEAGWDFVCESHQMQIFSSSLENPPPFETDAKEKLENLHKIMKKTQVMSQVIMLVVFALNLFLLLRRLQQNPGDFLANNIELALLLMMLSTVCGSLYYIISYYVWYNKSQRAIDLGGTIIEKGSKSRRYFNIIYPLWLLLIVGYMFFHLIQKSSLGIIAITALTTPLFAVVFGCSIMILKRLKISAKANKRISILLLVLTGILYLSFTFNLVARPGFVGIPGKEYKTVNWQMDENSTWEYRLYSDEIPLNCEDLYGASDFEYYSFEGEKESTVFLQKEHYRQNRPPMKDGPPELEYSIYKTKFSFVKNLVIDDLTRIPDWSGRKIQPLGNDVFSTENAFVVYYEDVGGKQLTGEYVLVFEDKIIHVKAEKSFTPEQIQIVKSKLIQK